MADVSMVNVWLLTMREVELRLIGFQEDWAEAKVTSAEIERLRDLSVTSKRMSPS